MVRFCTPPLHHPSSQPLRPCVLASPPWGINTHTYTHCQLPPSQNLSRCNTCAALHIITVTHQHSICICMQAQTYNTDTVSFHRSQTTATCNHHSVSLSGSPAPGGCGQHHHHYHYQPPLHWLLLPLQTAPHPQQQQAQQLVHHHLHHHLH